jgi:hypothetical protein
LMTNDPEALLQAVREVRKSHFYNNELHWTKQSNLRVRVYSDVAKKIRAVGDWEYKATCISAREFNLDYYDGREDLAYNRMVRHGIDAAMRFPKIDIHDALDITIDTKQRLQVDNCISYLREHYEGPFINDDDGNLNYRPVEVREIDSKAHDLVQVCDLISGAKHSLLAGICGARKAALAKAFWASARCRVWHSKLSK